MADPSLATLPPIGGERPRITVVIPTAGRPDALSETLSALDAQEVAEGDAELVVVDNSREGAAVTALAGWSGRLPLRVIHEATPGPAAARNAGIRAARAPVVLLLGDDMRPAAATLLQRHIDFHAEHPSAADGVVGRVTWRPDRPVNAFMHWLEHGGPQFDFDALAPGPVPAARTFYTSQISLKAAALRAAGGFDERFPFAAVEDIELGLRLERAGLVLHYEPGLLVQHDHQHVPAGFASRQERVGASARLMRELHGDHGLLPTPRWSWRLHRAARPALERASTLPLPEALRERTWAALAMAGYADGWAHAPSLLERARRGG